VLAGLSPARRRVVLGFVVLALVAAAALVATLIPRSAPARSPVAQDRPGPVLLVPGYGGSTGSLQSLADVLTAAGRDASVVGLPGDGTGDLYASAAALGRAVDATRKRTDAATVDLVG